MHAVRLGISGLAVALFGFALGTQRAQAQGDGPKRITVTGVGTVVVKPDTARVSFAVRASRGRLKDALEELDRRVTDLEKEILSLKIPGLALKKGPLNPLDSGFGPGRFGPGAPPGFGPGGPPVADVSRTFTVVIPIGENGDVKELVNRADKVLTTALELGGTDPPTFNAQHNGFFGGAGPAAAHSRIEFYRADASGPRQEALKRAVADAVATAKAAAGTANLTVKDIVTLTDQPASTAGLGVPITANRPEVLGEYELTVHVSVTFSY